MQRRSLIPALIAGAAILAVLAAVAVFRVRVFVAGGKLVLAVAAVIAVVWLLTRIRAPRD